MSLTPINKIYGTDDASTGDWQAESQAQATSIENAFTRRLGGQWHNYVWPTVTERNAQTGMYAGDLGYQVDIGAEFRYVASAWKQLPRMLTVPTMAALSGVASIVNGDKAWCSGDGFTYEVRNSTWTLPFWTTTKVEGPVGSSGSSGTSLGRTFPSGMNFLVQNADVSANGGTVFATTGAFGNTSGNITIAWNNMTSGMFRANYIGIAA